MANQPQYDGSSSFYSQPSLNPEARNPYILPGIPTNPSDPPAAAAPAAAEAPARAASPKPPSNRAPHPYPHLKLGKAAMWYCPKCSTGNRIKHGDPKRPFTKMICRCGTIASFSSPVENIDRFYKLPHMSYMVAIPKATTGSSSNAICGNGSADGKGNGNEGEVMMGMGPKTQFGWSCHACGVPHHKIPKLNTLHEPPKTFTHTFKNFLKNAASRASGVEVARVGEDEWVNPRITYAVHFQWKPCKCGHYCCEDCLRFRVEPKDMPEDQWVVEQAQDVLKMEEWLKGKVPVKG